MKVAVLEEKNSISIKSVDKPVLKDNEVIIKIEYVGICGSDIHYYQHGRIGDFIVKEPLVLGHECSGTIVEIGNKVNKFELGDRVVVEPGYGCNKCDYCKNGNYNLCDNMTFMATPPIDGAFAEYITYKEDMIFKLPDSMSTLEGSLIEPLAIGIYAAKVGQVEPNKKILIQGAGCIGLVTLLACKAFGTSDITITDIIDFRLEKAKELGALKTINISKEKIIETDFDIIIDCVGIESTMKTSVDYAKKGAVIVLVGMGSNDNIKFNLNRVISKELQLKTIFRYKNIFKTAIKLVEEKSIDISNIVSDTFSFDEIKKAFEYVSNNSDKVIKAVIKF